FVQGIVFRFAEPWELGHPWLLAFFAHASAATAAAAVISRWSNREAPDPSGSEGIVPGILTEAAAMTSIASALGLAWLVPAEEPGFIAGCALWLSALWAALAWLREWRPSFLAFQGA